METLEIKGYKAELTQEEAPYNPLEEWDMLGTFSCIHRKYDLSSPGNTLTDIEELQKHVKNRDVVALPLYLYDHSGITISTAPFACKWDSGQIGYIWVTKEKIRKDQQVKRITKSVLANVLKVLKSEVETYDMYLRGEVYRFTLQNPEGEEIDSCGGFFGEDSIKQEINMLIEADINK